MDLHEFVNSKKVAKEAISTRTRQIYGAVLSTSPYLTTGNFESFHTDDLKLLFEQYDERFLDGHCRERLGDHVLRFRVSKRMTKAAGSATRHRPRRGPGRPHFEIAVSSTLLFQCFGDEDHRPITVSGIACRDRLEALQRVFEHEVVHLVEMLLWDTSSCRASRFQNIAGGFFGHTEHTHELITPKERAFVKYKLHPGCRVRFRFDDAEHVGILNRITKRATVLVEDPTGVPYSDGKRYAKFYVPVGMLEKVQE